MCKRIQTNLVLPPAHCFPENHILFMLKENKALMPSSGELPTAPSGAYQRAHWQEDVQVQ